MIKVLWGLGLSAIIMTCGLSADEKIKSETKVSGLYIGVGGGASFGGVVLAKSDYVSDGTYNYEVGTMYDYDGGYTIYGGYHINKIVAVEVSFTDYGYFSDTLPTQYDVKIKKIFSSDPLSGAVYANLGYTFSNGWRPFGLIGLGYLQSNLSSSMEKLNGFSDNYLTIHYGVGGVYAPSSLDGLGFRVALSGDTSKNYNSVITDENSEVQDDVYVMRFYQLVYVGIQYKF